MRAEKGIVWDVTQPNSPAPARRGLARLAAAALVVVGLVGSIAAAGAWRSSVEERAQQSMEVPVGAASAAVASNVASSVDLLDTLPALVVATADLNYTQFARSWDQAARAVRLHGVLWCGVVLVCSRPDTGCGREGG